METSARPKAEAVNRVSLEEQTVRKSPSGRILHDLDERKEENSMKHVVLVIYLVLILLGVGTGFVLAKGRGGAGSSAATVTSSGKTVVGVNDKIFKDSAEGTLQKGGIDGEGTHKLIRPGGESQTAYLVSSVIDLDQYVGKKVKVWGQTIDAQKASWLMDVGKVEVE